jgi:AraC family transcriptional regulator, arabinose operon regulatory protein
MKILSPEAFSSPTTVLKKSTSSSPPFRVTPSNNCDRFRCPAGWYRSRSDSEALRDQELWLVWAGHGWMQTKRARIEMHPGFCVWMRPGGIYDARQDEDDPLGITFVHFSLDDGALNKRNTYPEFYDLWDLSYLDSVTRRIVEIMSQRDPSKDLKATAGLLLSGVLMDLTTNSSSQNKTGSRSVPMHQKVLIQQIARYIYDTVGSTPSVTDLARKAGYSPAHFSTLFKKVTGQTAESMIVRSRIDKARQLLRWSDLSMGEIAETTGYHDVYFFSRQFKQKTGKTPTDYRSSTREQLAERNGEGVTS